jgi:hypothetical protein
MGTASARPIGSRRFRTTETSWSPKDLRSGMLRLRMFAIFQGDTTEAGRVGCPEAAVARRTRGEPTEATSASKEGRGMK